MTNNNKKDILLRLFADNTIGNITAATLRQFIEDIFEDKEHNINKFSTLDKFEEQENSDIYEGSLVAITNSTSEENGLYISQINQPRERKFLTQISNKVNLLTETKHTYEYTAKQGQNIFACNYTYNLVDVYVNGKKIRGSQIVYNSGASSIPTSQNVNRVPGVPGTLGTSVTLLTPLNKGDEVEIISIIKE